MGASRLAMLDDILQGFLQDTVETQGDFPWQRLRDVLDVDVNRHVMPIGQLFAERRRCPFQAQELESRGVKAVRQRLNVAHEIGELLADRPDLLIEIGR